METFNDPFGVIGDGAWGGAPEPEDQPLKFAQGKVIAWQPLDGTNTIRIQGVDFPNLPVMSSSEAVQIRVGDVVGCLKYLNTYMILGRVSPPTVAAQRGGNITSVDHATVGNQSGVAQNVWLDKLGGPGATNPPTIAVNVGPARRALVWAGGSFAIQGGVFDIAFKVTGASNLTPAVPQIHYAEAGSDIPGGSLYTASTAVSTLTATAGLNEGINYFTPQYRYTDLSGGSGSGYVFDVSLAVMTF